MISTSRGLFLLKNGGGSSFKATFPKLTETALAFKGCSVAFCFSFSHNTFKAYVAQISLKGLLSQDRFSANPA